MCGMDGCQSMFHHLCQTEWEIHQYHLDYPNGDPQDCIYDLGGKKRCVQHHPHGNLAGNSPSISGKELNSTKDTHLATSQGDDSTSEPDNKSKDGSIGPPQNQGDETDLKEIQMIILNQSMAVTKEVKPILNLLPNRRAHGPSVQRVANCLGLSPKMCVV